ncbi:hypothetical protein CF335_g9510, partial [Tilletia laevis]
MVVGSGTCLLESTHKCLVEPVVVDWIPQVVIINSSDTLPESGRLQTANNAPGATDEAAVEEMIKRSFSENASQKMLPDQQKKVKDIERQLNKLAKGMLQTALDQQQGSKNMASGRIVLVRHHLFENDGAVIVKQINSRLFLTLATVTPERKSKTLDVAENSKPPLWNPTLKGRVLDGLVYDLVEVPLTSIVLVTKHVVKIEPSMIMAHRISAMQGAVNAMIPYLLEWS